MAQSWRGWQLGLASVLATSTLGDYAFAQPRPVSDNTLGTERSVVTSLDPDFPIDVIDGGAKRGANLFHSFQEFNIEVGRGAYFSNPDGIKNILSRVTGNSRSDILGTLGVLGKANLFLINPNGIIFGPNASLDVNGSFVATTANAIKFDNQGFFSASDTAASPALLSISPSAFLFNQIAAQPIQVNSGGFREFDPNTYERLYDKGLRVPDNRSLVLLGGDVIIDSGSLAAPGGRIELAGVAGSGTVGLTIDGSNLSLNVPDNLSRADVSLSQFLADVVAGGGGSITVNARNLSTLDNSELRAGIGDGLGSVNARAGDIMLNATGAMTIADSYILNGLGDLELASGKLPALGAVGRGGDINIRADSLRLDDARLETGTAGQGDAGNLSIRANESVSLISSGISSNSWDKAVGRGGDINIQAGSLSLTGFSSLLTGTQGQGDSGNIFVQVDDSVLMRGSNISTRVLSNTIGQGGDVTIEAEAGSISFDGGTSINTSTYGRGDAGDVFVRASNPVLLRGSVIQTRVESDEAGVPGSRAEGNGGDITIQAESLSLIDLSPSGGFRAVLSTSTNSDGNAGNLLVQVDDSVSVTSSIISAAVESKGVGQGGNIDIQTESLSLNDGAFVNTSTLGEGRGGDIRITAPDFIRLSGVDSYGFTSEVATSTRREAVGRAGDITIDTGALRLFDGAVVNARTLNSSSGGNITINANILEATNGGQVVTTSLDRGRAGRINLDVTDSITLAGRDRTFSDRRSRITAQFGEDEVSSAGPESGLFANTAKDSVAQGGDLTISTRQLNVRNDAEVTVNSEGTGNAGNLEVQASSIQLDKRGAIAATARSGNGGDITLGTVDSPLDLLLMRNRSQISTTAGIAGADGNGGNIRIDTNNLVAVEDSNITANAFEGQGGRVKINTQGDFRSADSDITASSDLGIDGAVEINTPDIDPSQGVVALPEEVVDVSRLVTQRCPAGGGAVASRASKFVVTGRGGLPPDPSDPSSSDTGLADWITLDPRMEPRSSPASIPDQKSSEATPIVEAQGWARDSKGQIVLTAQALTVTPHSSRLVQASCPGS